MRYIVGAYASSPCQTAWDEKAEAAFLDGILAIPGVGGLELPFNGALHGFDEAWLLSRLSAGSHHVITCLPGTMQRLARAPAFGLASDDAAGREAAVAFVREARDAVARLHDRLGTAAVMAVELHTAPRRSTEKTSTVSLAASLAELAGLDWQGAALVIEHCDAFTTAHPPEKGFLTLAEEMAVPGIGMTVNWGRSVLETRDAATGAAHVATLAAAGRLAGVMFSGCGATPGPFGAWQDTHMPHDEVAPGSLLTRARIAETLAAAAGASFMGVKLGARPADLPVAARVAQSAGLMAIVRAG